MRIAYEFVFSFFATTLQEMQEISIQNVLYGSGTGRNVFSEPRRQFYIPTKCLWDLQKLGKWHLKQTTKRGRGVAKAQQIFKHFWKHIFRLSWPRSSWLRSLAFGRMSSIQICFGFVLNRKTHPETFQKHLRHSKLKFLGRKCAHVNFCQLWQKHAERRSKIV